MEPDPTKRFSSRVEDYIRYRPSYPAAVITWLERDCGITAAARVADIGSGTGILSRLFLDFGCRDFGVEPNADMRAAAERLLAAEPRFHSVDGRAEATTLPGASVDFVTAGQSFHWFDPAAARAKFRRILVPEGWVVLIWNERLVTPGFPAEYEDLLLLLSTDYGRSGTSANRRGGDRALFRSRRVAGGELAHDRDRTRRSRRDSHPERVQQEDLKPPVRNSKIHAFEASIVDETPLRCRVQFHAVRPALATSL